MPTTKITVIGHVCIDKNTSENSSYSAAGGPAIFMHKIYKQLPHNQLTIITPYGADFLAHKGNARLHPANPRGKKTLLYENITKNGVRLQKAHHQDAANPIPVSPPLKKLVSLSDIVFIAPLLPNFPPLYLKNILSQTPPETLKVLLPQGYFRNFDATDTVRLRSFTEAADILPLVDAVIVSEQDYPNMLSLGKIWAHTHKILVIVTLGEKGALSFTFKKDTRLPTRAVPENQVVDSVGSGDIFAAGFAYRYQQTRDLAKAGRFANALARQCLFYTPGGIKIDSGVLTR